MATSSITANFACNDSKAANTFVELMFSPNVDSYRSPEDYTTWHQRHFDNGESVRELGEKIKKFIAAKRQSAMA